MPDESWLGVLGRRGQVSRQQCLDAKLEQMRYRISIEQALIKFGISSEDIIAVKKELSLSLEESYPEEIDSEEVSNLYNELTEEIWNSIGKNPDIIGSAPKWVRDKLNIPFDKIMQLPTFNSVAWLDIHDERRFVRRPEARSMKLDQSYIDLLQGKIKYDNLSTEFIQTCKRTIRALEQHFDQNLIMIRIYGNCTYLLDITADNLEYIHSKVITLEMIQKAISEKHNYFC